MLRLTIRSIQSKPTGHIYSQKDANDQIIKSWISQGGKYLKWKSEQVKLVQKQLPPNYQTKNRVWGVVMRISINPNRKGHPPDKYNLAGSVADILTQAGVWTDDNIRVSDLSHQRIVYNQQELTTVFICDNILEYIAIVLDELFFINQVT